MGEFLDVENLESVQDLKLLYQIDPNEIKYLPQEDFSIESKAEKISDGNWDSDLRSFEDSEISLAIRDVFFHDKTWEDTAYFSDTLQTTEILCEQDRGHFKKMRCVYLNHLFKSMRVFGYAQDPLSDLVGILIGRNGEIILNNGRHRVAIAQALSIPSIPVTIDVRHSDWVKFCDEVHAYAIKHRGRVYAPIKHIDLRHLPSRQVDRSGLVMKHMSPKSKTMVDLGSNWGQMCQQLEGYFDRCVAVEVDPEEFKFLERFKKAYGCSYDTINMDAVEFISDQKDWDCVLMLSILHHIPLEKREELFESLNAKEMFFQFPSKKELDVDTTQWINLILTTSCFSKAVQINNSDREMFHFTR